MILVCLFLFVVVLLSWLGFFGAFLVVFVCVGFLFCFLGRVFVVFIGGKRGGQNKCLNDIETIFRDELNF